MCVFMYVCTNVCVRRYSSQELDGFPTFLSKHWNELIHKTPCSRQGPWAETGTDPQVGMREGGGARGKVSWICFPMFCKKQQVKLRSTSPLKVY